MKDFWDGRRVLVTGGTGFVGGHLVEALLRRAPSARITIADKIPKPGRLPWFGPSVRVLKADLRRAEDCRRVCRGQDLVLHLAARVAGVGYNIGHQASMFQENMLISLNTIEAARACGVGRFVDVSSACVYARECPIPMREEDGFLGRPEPTNEGYGWAKRMTEFLAGAYGAEFGMQSVIVRPVNAYGPRDHFEREDCHVIAALVRRVVAGEDPVTVWGDGSQIRSFLYVEDFAQGLLAAAERGRPGEVLNLASDEEISVRDLAGLIRDAAGSLARLVFDTTKPTGQPRRLCATEKAASSIGFKARISLAEGLRRTVVWYLAHQASL